MFRSFYVALSGLNASKDWLDITSNNIANANTIGFKRSRPVFQDLVLQNIIHYNALSGSITHTTYGGGVLTSMTQTIFTPGSFKTTGVSTDIAIDGDGFLVLQDSSGRQYYTRDGELKFASKVENGVQYMYLVHNSGLNVLAYDISQLQNVPNARGCPRLSPIRIRVEIPAQATQHITTQEGANIDPRAQIINQTFNPTDATTYDSTYSLQVYDAQGRAHDVGIFFVKLPAVKVQVQDSSGNTTDYYVSIDDNGALVYQKNGQYYNVDKSSSTVTVNSNDELITIRSQVVTPSGTYDLVYDKTLRKYYLKDNNGNYYDLVATTTAATTGGNILRLDNLWQVYTLKNDNGTWIDLTQTGLTDGSNYKFSLIAFNQDGTLAGVTGATNWTPTTLSTNTKINLQDPQGILTVSDWNLEGLTSYPVDFSLGFTQDGYPPGRVQTVNIGSDGTITAVYNNGVSKNLYRLGLAYFNDKQVLSPTGNNLFEISTTTATPLLECAGVRSQIRSGVLELSNVDVAEELINMITAEKAYQANAKVIQTGQTILDTTINLKR